MMHLLTFESPMQPTMGGLLRESGANRPSRVPFAIQGSIETGTSLKKMALASIVILATTSVALAEMFWATMARRTWPAPESKSNVRNYQGGDR